MKNAIALVLTLIIANACASSGGVYHGVIMRGSILEVNRGEAYLCIGSKDGARAGQQLNVVRFKKVPGKNPRWLRTETGKVEITVIVDEHFARARVLEGSVLANDTAILEK